MSDGLLPHLCPDCGGELEFLDRHSFTGRVFREYWCKTCERVVTEGGEVALWQALSDIREAESAAAAAAAAAKKQNRPWWKLWK